jgi:hypothetical protein
VDAWIEEIKASRKEMTACQEATEAWVEMEAAVDVFEERLGKMVNILGSQSGRNKESELERQEVPKEYAAVETNGDL